MRLTLSYIIALCASLLTATQASAQGWPANYGGVMLQGFYWDSYVESQWSYLEKQSNDIAPYFSLIWCPPSANANSVSGNMGYYPAYFFNQNSSFGTEGQLRSMIATYKAKGTGIIADVVVNHHASTGTDYDFTSETYKDATYQLLSTDICSNDEAKTAATAAGKKLSTNADTGDNDGGCRDLDHKSANVNAIVKAYENFLLNDLGYAGFRYDMVKGYSASYIKDYNETAKPQFSVGENWSGTSTIKSWINGTKDAFGTPTSAAFDFQFRYRMREAITQGNWTLLTAATQGADGKPLIQDEAYRQYAVTFVDNHDMRETDPSNGNCPITTNVTAANAYLLAMPGTPCVFYRHWLAYKKDIKMMIEARRLAGITNTSTYQQLPSSMNYNVVRTTGTKGSLICVVGKTPTAYTVPAGYRLLCSGSDYCYYISAEAYVNWDSIKARIESEEQEEEFKPYDITITITADFTPVYLYAWDNKNTQLLGSWPGKQIVASTATKPAETSYTFTIKSKDAYVNIIFNQGNNKPQTSDILGLTTSKHYTARLSGGKVLYEDVTPTAIAPVYASPASPFGSPAIVPEASASGSQGSTFLTPSGIVILKNGALYTPSGLKK